MFYIRKAIEHGWSRNMMVMMQIETALHKRQEQAITNFKDKLQSPQSDLAHYTLKDSTISDYYTQLCWTKIGIDEFKSHPVTVMEVDL